MKQFQIRFFLLLTVTITAVMSLTGQNSLPDVLLKGSLKEQLNFLEERTRIYENYRAIREDMFQKLKSNVTDTIALQKIRIGELDRGKQKLNLSLDSVSTSLASAKSGLDQMTRTKNSISIFGIEVKKSTYNRLTWTLLTGLLAALLVGFIFFKRNLSAIINSKNEYKELKAEFESYRKTTREAREKMTMDHFNEIRRLKAGAQ